jgi:hypothetical protein
MNKTPLLWIAVALGLLVAAGLSFGRKRPHSDDMGNIATKTATSDRVRRAANARRRRAEDKADYALAKKRLADIDAGRVKALSREEFLRALDLRG